jgi:hypothetical protein
MSAHGVCQQWFGLSIGKFCDTALCVLAISFPLSSRKAVITLYLNCHQLISACETRTFSTDKLFSLLSVHEYVCKGNTVPLRSWTGPEGSEAPRYQDNQHMKVVRLSALCTSHLYPPGNIPGTHFC